MNWRDEGILRKIILAPERLHIGEVKASFLMLWIRQIKNGAWHNVVNMPLPIVIPVHSLLEKAFEIKFKRFNRTSQEVHSSIALRNPFHRFIESGAQVD